MFDSIDVSVSSIAFDSLEYLKTLSNFCKLFVLKFVKAVKISDFILHPLPNTLLDANTTA